MVVNPDFEQNIFSRTVEYIYKIGHDGIKLMKCLAYYDRSYSENKSYWFNVICFKIFKWSFSKVDIT